VLEERRKNGEQNGAIGTRVHVAAVVKDDDGAGTDSALEASQQRVGVDGAGVA